MSYPTDVNKKWNRVDLKGGIFQNNPRNFLYKVFFYNFHKEITL